MVFVSCHYQIRILKRASLKAHERPFFPGITLFIGLDVTFPVKTIKVNKKHTHTQDEKKIKKMYTFPN